MKKVVYVYLGLVGLLYVVALMWGVAEMLDVIKHGWESSFENWLIAATLLILICIPIPTLVHIWKVYILSREYGFKLNLYRAIFYWELYTNFPFFNNSKIFKKGKMKKKILKGIRFLIPPIIGASIVMSVYAIFHSGLFGYVWFSHTGGLLEENPAMSFGEFAGTIKFYWYIVSSIIGCVVLYLAYGTQVLDKVYKSS